MHPIYLREFLGFGGNNCDLDHLAFSLVIGGLLQCAFIAYFESPLGG